MYLSPLQVLPQHVVRIIVRHVAENTRLLSRIDAVNQRLPSPQLIPLLWICRNFRSDVYSHYSQYYLLELDREHDSVLISPYSWPPNLINAVHSTHHMARYLSIRLDPFDIICGESQKLLSCAPYNGRAFPLVRTITFHLASRTRLLSGGLVDDELDPLVVQANIGAFIRQVEMMAPRVAEIRLQFDYSPTSTSKALQWYFSVLAIQLYRITNRLEYGGQSWCESMEMQMQASKIQNLVLVNSHIHSKAIRQLISLNAATLQSLNITLYTAECARDLIRGANGEFIHYPHMRILKLLSHVDSDQVGELVFPGSIPFPQLRHICVNGKHPFGDDTLFRGNAVTLEQLGLDVGIVAVQVLCMYNVFTPTSHPSLQSVRIRLGGANQDDIAAYAANMHLVLSIGCCAAVRDIDCVPYFAELPRMLSLGKDHSCVQVLVLMGTSLELWDILACVKELPLLSDLHCITLGLGPMPKGVSEDTLPSFVRSTYAPMGKRFRFWSYFRMPQVSLEAVAECALLLALACPNFDYASPGYEHGPFMANMTNLIASDRFQPYAPRLRRLLACQ